MSENDSTEPNARPKGISMSTLLALVAGMVVVAALLLAGVLYFTLSSKAQLERQIHQAEIRQAQEEIARQKAADNAKLALARNRQDDVLAHARTATNLVERLLSDANRLASQADALKASDSGRLVALDADLVAQARRLYEVQLKELPTQTEITTRLEGVRRIEQQIQKSLGTAYEPEADLRVTAQNTALWAEQAASKVGQAQAMLDALTGDAKVKNPTGALPANSLTLEAAIAKLKQDEVAQRQRELVRVTDDAKKKADETEAVAESNRILAEAKAKADKMLSDAMLAAESAKRQQDLKQAQGLVAAATNQVAIDQAQLEARKTVLRQKASSPAIQAKLAPFITPGIWQITGRATVDLKPLSYTHLQNAGALERAGLQKLVSIGVNHYDKVRPRWKFLTQYRIDRSKPEDVKTATEAQDLLKELGPVLVEMNLLQP